MRGAANTAPLSILNYHKKAASALFSLTFVIIHWYNHISLTVEPTEGKLIEKRFKKRVENQQKYMDA